MTNARNNTPNNSDRNSFLKRAHSHLEIPLNQDWTKDARYTNCGRIPMKNYPLVWLSPVELAQIIELYTDSIPEKYWRVCFVRAQSTLLSYSEHKRCAVNAFGWLIGWVLEDTMKIAVKAKYLGYSNPKRKL